MIFWRPSLSLALSPLELRIVYPAKIIWKRKYSPPKRVRSPSSAEMVELKVSRTVFLDRFVGLRLPVPEIVPRGTLAA